MDIYHTPPPPPSLPLKTFQEFEDYLDSLGLFRMSPGLERIETVLKNLGLKRPPFVVAQVVGTNGKGSTSSMLASLGLAHGVKTGLHTSPHFLSVRERIRINGNMLDETAWLSLANRLLASGGENLSYFECVTTLAVMAFAEYGVELAVMETGLGGAFDATTALDVDLVLFTPFGLDHQTTLGPTLQDIAQDKAGAIRSGVPVVISPGQPQEALERIEETAAARRAPIYTASSLVERLPEPLRLALAGSHQRANASTALLGWRYLTTLLTLPDTTDPEKSGQHPSLLRQRLLEPLTPLERDGLATAWLPGRFQCIQPTENPIVCQQGKPVEQGTQRWPWILLDGAHNDHAFSALEHALAAANVTASAAVFSCMADKSPEELIQRLQHIVSGPIFIPPIPDNPRAISPESLAALTPQAIPTNSLSEALTYAFAYMEEHAPEAFSGSTPIHPLLVCGSLYLLGNFFALRPDSLIASPTQLPVTLR